MALGIIVASICVCLVSSQELKILLGDKKPAIFDVNLKANKVNTLSIINIARPIAIDYDADNNVIYWTDVLLHQIWSRDLGTSDTRLILSSNETSIMDGLAIDVGRKKLFYTDAGYDVIASINTDGTGNNVLIDSGHDNPRAIVLHEERRQIYWTDWGIKAFIAKADYDGNSNTKIVTMGRAWPNGLTLDKRGDVLYWCDAYTHKIEAVNVDGSGRRLVINEPGAHYFGIFYHNEALFFTDWKRRSVLTFPATNGSRVGTISSSHFIELNGIHVYSTMDFSDCPFGRYGRYCSECGHCLEGSVCDKTTGICLAGCSSGYTGNHCEEECPSGTYGLKCGQICGDCIDASCHHVTGTCDVGCIPGKQGLDCKTACPANTYGSCTPCGQCKDREPCVVASGYCPTGCEQGWTGSRCNTQEDATTDSSSTGITDHVLIIGVVAGVVAIILVIVVVIVIIVIFYMRRKRQMPKPDENYASLRTNGPDNPYSVAEQLPPAYATINDIHVRDGGYEQFPAMDPFRRIPDAPYSGNHSSLFMEDDVSGQKFVA